MSDKAAKIDFRQFKPAGPVCARFIESEGPFDFIRGPWGSGKTVSAVFKGVRHASNLFPVCKDGVIHVRQAAVRDTYRELAKTALPSWHRFFPKRGPFNAPDKDAYQGGIDRPVRHILEWDVKRMWPGPRGQWDWKLTKVRFEMDFGAIGSENLETFFKGYEISLGWLNECDTMHEDVPGLLFGRTGRYPPRDEIMEWEGDRLGWQTDPDTGLEVIRVPRLVFGDFNPPDEVNWTYRREIEEPEKWPGYNFFAQPSGLSAEAENRERKTRADYEAEEKAFGGPKAPDAIRNTHGRYAPKRQGTVVYDRFALDVHRADQPLAPIRELPFYMGLDAGGTPACAIGQILPSGKLRALREIVCRPDTVTGPSRFAQMINEVLLADFAGMRCGGAWGDPSAWYGADKQNGELAFMETVSLALSIPISPTASNDIASRKEAVDWYLIVDGSEPRSVWDPRLKYTIRGFVSQYHLTKAGSEGRTDRLEIAKNEYSHIHDSWQYLCFGYRGPQNVLKEAARIGRPGNVTPIAAARTKNVSIWDL